MQCAGGPTARVYYEKRVCVCGTHQYSSCLTYEYQGDFCAVAIVFVAAAVRAARPCLDRGEQTRLGHQG